MKAPYFAKYPKILADHHVVEFMTDYLRIMVSGNLNAMEIENLMDMEIETHHHEAMVSSHVIAKVGDGMPAFGIVAAVMGVVHTMESVGIPPAELGMLIAHALVGTFLGILLAYGFVGPSGRSAGTEGRRGWQDVPGHQSRSAGQPQRLCAGDGGGIRTQGAEFDRTSWFRRTGRTCQTKTLVITHNPVDRTRP